MKAAALQMLLDFCSHNTHSSLEMVKEEHKSAVNSFSLWDAFTSAPLRPAASWEVGACAWREKSPRSPARRRTAEVGLLLLSSGLIRF